MVRGRGVSTRRVVAVLLSLSCLHAAAAPQVQGRPVYSVSPPGPVLVRDGGGVGVQVHLDDAGLLRLALIDVRVGAPANAVLGEVTAELFKEGEPVDVTPDLLASGPRQFAVGEEGRLGASVQALDGWVFVLSAAVAQEVLSDVDEVQVTVTVPGAGVDATGEVPTLHLDGERPVALALGGEGTGEGGTGLIRRSAPVSSTSPVIFFLGVGANAEAARQSVLRDMLVGPAPIPRRITPPANEPVLTALSRVAQDHLASNRTPSGQVAHRGYDNLHWTWPSVWQAWALAESDGAAALAALEAHRRGQWLSADHPEHGVRFARVDAEGVSPLLGQVGASEYFTQLAPFGLALRALQDANGRPSDDALRAWVDSGLDAFGWYARRRDRDEALRYELNGALEHPLPQSPRFDAFWQGQERNLPLGDGTTRPALNAVDLNAWLAHEAQELWRLGSAFGHPRAEEARNRMALIDRVLDANEGHWNDTQRGWFDFVRRGGDRTRDFGPQVRTPALWAPLSAGLLRDTAVIQDVVQRHVLDPVFFTEKGVPAWEGGPISVTETALTVMALARYGYEEEAQTLRARLGELIATNGPNIHARYEPSGAPIGPGGDGAASAAVLLLSTRAYESEVYALQRGAIANARYGRFRRVFRPTDGRTALEVIPQDGAPQPLVRLSSETQLFSLEPLKVEFEGEGAHVLHLPLIAEAEVVRGSETLMVEGSDQDGIRLEVSAGDSVEIRTLRFAGERGGCGCRFTGTSPFSALMALILLGQRARRRQSPSTSGRVL